MPDWPEWAIPSLRYCCGCGVRVTNKSGFGVHSRIGKAGKDVLRWVTCLGCVGSVPVYPQDFHRIPT